MTTKQMEYIVELSRTRNFNRAAENLYITQPALSYQIKRAEEELGFLLFHRSGRGAIPTESCQRFAKTLAQLLEEYDSAVDECKRFGIKQEVSVTIGVPHRIYIPRFVEWKEAFEAAYPQIPVMLRYYDSDTMPESDLLANVDIVIRIKSKKNRVGTGWREYAVMQGYMGADILSGAGTQNQSDEDGIIWVPYHASAIEMSLLGRADEKREVVHNFISIHGDYT